MANYTKKKSVEITPEIQRIMKYENDIVRLEDEYQKANEEHDWLKRNAVYAMLVSKRFNYAEIIGKYHGSYQPKIKITWETNY